MTSPRVVSASLDIAGSPAAIFAILADPRRHHLIDGSESIQGVVAGPQRLELGSTFGMKMRIGLPYRVRNTVVEYVADRRIAWRHQARHVWRYELEPTSGGTRVTESWDWGPSPFALPMQLLGFPARNAAAIRASLQRLRDLVESVPPDPALGGTAPA